MKFEFDHKTGMMVPKKDDNIYFGRSISGGLRIDDHKNNVTYILERDGSLKKLFGNFRGDSINIYDDRDAHIIADRALRVFGRDYKFSDYRMFSKNFHKRIDESRLGRIMNNSFSDDVRGENGRIITLDDAGEMKFVFVKGDEFFDRLILPKFRKFEGVVNVKVPFVYEFDTYDNRYVSFTYNKDKKEGGYWELFMDADKSLEDEDFLEYVNVALEGELLKQKDNGVVEFTDGDTYFEISIDDDSTRYKMFDSISDAEDLAKQYALDLLNEYIDSMFNKKDNNQSAFERYVGEYGDEWVDFKALKDWYREDKRTCYEDYSDEEIIDELISGNIIDETEEYFGTDDDGDIDKTSPKFEPSDYVGDLVDKYVDDFNYIVDLVDEIRLNFGADGLVNIDKQIDFLDFDKLSKMMVTNYGAGEQLASYDGKEVEIDYNGTTYYIYRTN